MRKLLFAMVGSALMACTNISSSNAENVTSVRHIDNYTGIDAGQGIKVNVVAGFSDSLTVSAPADIIDRIVTEVKNETLIIRWDKKANIKSPRRIEVTVPMCAVNQIKASSGATVITDTVKGNELKFSVSSGAQINTMVEAQSVTAESSSGASLKIIGKAESANYDVSSGASITADKLQAANVTAEASSGAGMTVNAGSQLEAKAHSGARIRYSGSPNMVNVESGSGGSISRL
ncbi:MAG: DUF2807 domain-containing protein [Salinivirgaceae bacterium]|nr:DUF2807 domain-containing protein [Salinivirgaceae bacterium]